jgi:aminomethyltransferase
MELKRTPFYDLHLLAGARMVPFAGFEMPVQYAGLLKEHAQVRTGVGVFDVSHMGEVWVTGPKAEDALMWLLSNAIRRVGIGQAQYNVMCNQAGGVVDDVVVYRLGPEEFMVCVNAANRAKDFAWMVENNPFPDGATFTNHSDAWGQLAIQGPKAMATVQKMTDIDLSPLGTYRFAVGSCAGVAGCIIARTGYTGEDGFEIFLPLEVEGAAETLWRELMEAGEEFGIQPIGLGARDTLRLEVRYCLYGHELNDELSPLQAGLGWVCKLKKPGGFLGAEAIGARRAGDRHTLVGMMVDGKRIARDGMRVLADGQDVGWVSSGTRSPSIQRSILLAYVDSTYAQPGTQLTIDVRGREATAEVVEGPFYKRGA